MKLCSKLGSRFCDPRSLKVRSLSLSLLETKPASAYQSVLCMVCLYMFWHMLTYSLRLCGPNHWVENGAYVVPVTWHQMNPMNANTSFPKKMERAPVTFLKTIWWLRWWLQWHKSQVSSPILQPRFISTDGSHDGLISALRYARRSIHSAVLWSISRKANVAFSVMHGTLT